MKPILEARALTVTVAGRTICRRFDLRLTAGSRTAVLGINGAGKTTLLLTLAGLREPAGGEILLDGEPIGTLSARARARRVSFMAQDDLEDPEATVLDTALLGCLPSRPWWQAIGSADEARARAAISRVELAGYESRAAATLSGGERRRLALALMLVQDAPLLVLDEPSSHLDLHQQVALLDLLVALEGRTLLMSLHDVNLAARYCDQAILLYPGGEVEAGPAAGLLRAETLSRVYRHPVRALPAGERTVFHPG